MQSTKSFGIVPEQKHQHQHPAKFPEDVSCKWSYRWGLKRLESLDRVITQSWRKSMCSLQGVQIPPHSDWSQKEYRSRKCSHMVELLTVK